ncbi:hypothetical protein [Schnuerera sp.]|uniref:hypothetical protein n=1 Tax=Schnuerera sp. TaxID=2794844 RepID=UPI002BEE7C49|nr:hypothetical protein [Schnuerera sp.]HSH35109.1 hypothetical protein [Schnuerera sp.]
MSRLGEALENYQGNLTVVELARQADGKGYKQSGVEKKVPQGLHRVDLDVRPIGDNDVIFKNYDYGEYMPKKKKKETSTHVQTRPYPNPIFENYDYGGSEEGSEISPGRGLYHGKMDKYKSVADFLEKKRKARKKRKQAMKELFNFIVLGYEKE